MNYYNKCKSTPFVLSIIQVFVQRTVPKKSWKKCESAKLIRPKNALIFGDKGDINAKTGTRKVPTKVIENKGI